MPDIDSEERVLFLVTTFYSRMLKDNELAPFFSHIDLKTHLPRMADFWSFILIDKPGYNANVFEKHINLPLKAVHFDLWLRTFKKTIVDFFEGPKARLACERAELLKYTFMSKLKIE